MPKGYTRVVQVHGTHRMVDSSAVAVGLAMMAANRGLRVIYKLPESDADRVAAYFDCEQPWRDSRTWGINPISETDPSVQFYENRTGSIVFEPLDHQMYSHTNDADCDLYVRDEGPFGYDPWGDLKITGWNRAARVLVTDLYETSLTRAESAGDYDFGLVVADPCENISEHILHVANRLRWSGAQFLSLTEPLIHRAPEGILRHWAYVCGSAFELICDDIVTYAMDIEITEHNV